MVVGEFTQETDLVIIGGGPAGYAAAFRAAELGVQTVIVDSRRDGALGGVCLHEGCIPSKTLLHVAEMIDQAEHPTQLGVSFGKPKIDLAAIRSWKENSIKKLAAGLESQCKKHGVERIQGRAHFEDSRNIALLDSTIPRIRFRRALLAVGATPKVHANIPFDGNLILTPGEALKIDLVPKSLLIVGDDYMAVELAAIYSSLGSAVTLASPAERLLPEVDIDLARPLIKRLESRLSGLHNGIAVAKAEIDGKIARVKFEGPEAPKSGKFELVIVANGHVGNTRGLQLEKTKVELDSNEFVGIDAHMRTADPRIFAAGDVTGAPLLADKALHQGRIAAEVIAGKATMFDARVIPTAIFTDPQIAWCGLIEEDAKRQGVEYAVARIPWGASGRAVGMGRSEGLTKIIYDPHSQVIFGIGMVGFNACELIAEGALAIEMGAVLTDLAATIHPHPTVSELISDVARQATTHHGNS